MMVIPTKYNGCSFRSRLEARWAVFMDIMGIYWEYEPDGYELDGVRYLPDFYLKLQDVFLEIKPKYPTNDEEKKARLLAEFTKKQVFILFSDFKIPDHFDESDSAIMLIENGWDNMYWWCQCPHCKRTEIQFNGRADRIKCGCPKSDHGDKGYNYSTPELEAAYVLAKSYRFGI